MLAANMEIVNAHHAKRRVSGLTLIELLVIIGVLALLAAVLLPALASAKRKTSKINCISNLKQCGIAFRLWEGDNGDHYPQYFVLTNAETMKLLANGNAYLLWQTMSNELNTPKILRCPNDEKHTNAWSFSDGFSDANLSYFLNLDASETYPQMIMIGDDNLALDGVPVKSGILTFAPKTTIAWTQERHHNVGNIGMADGSAQQVTSDGLRTALAVSTNGVSTNTVTPRWLIP